MKQPNYESKTYLTMRYGSGAPSFFIVGLLVVICVLSYNYWSLSTSNKHLKSGLHESQTQFRDCNVQKSAQETYNENTSNKLRVCSNDLDTLRNQMEKSKQDLQNLREDLDDVKQGEADCKLSQQEEEENHEKELNNLAETVREQEEKNSLLQDENYQQKDRIEQLEASVHQINNLKDEVKYFKEKLYHYDQLAAQQNNFHPRESQQQLGQQGQNQQQQQQQNIVEQHPGLQYQRSEQSEQDINLPHHGVGESHPAFGGHILPQQHQLEYPQRVDRFDHQGDPGVNFMHKNPGSNVMDDKEELEQKQQLEQERAAQIHPADGVVGNEENQGDDDELNQDDDEIDQAHVLHPPENVAGHVEGEQEEEEEEQEGEDFQGADENEDDDVDAGDDADFDGNDDNDVEAPRSDLSRRFPPQQVIGQHQNRFFGPGEADDFDDKPAGVDDRYRNIDGVH